MKAKLKLWTGWDSVRRLVRILRDAPMAYREAVRLAKVMHRRSWAKTAPQWDVCDTTSGVISQIDNMHAGSLELLDWAESLLCNAVPMPHCTQEEWDAAVQKWRDQKHGIYDPNDEMTSTHH